MRNSCVLPVLILALASLSSGEAALAQREDFSFWTQIAASDATAGAGFGREATLSADGATALVSASMGDCSVSPCAPAAYVFVRDRGGWIQQAKLPAPGNPPGEINLRIALSGDGNTALLGVAGVGCALGGRCGAVYVFSRNGATWTLQQTLRASDPKAQGYFGVAVSISGDGNTALIGSIGAFCGTSPSSCGAAYVFTRSGGVWTERQKLLEPIPHTFFGRSVTLSRDGNTALVVGGFDFGTFFSGRVYVFTRSGDVWSLQDTILPPAGVNDFASTDEAISADGNIILARGVAGSYGSVFVFIRTGNAWSQETVLSGSSTTYSSGASFDLTDDGQTAIVVSQPGICAPSCGPVDVFSRNGGAWDPVQQFAPSGLAGGAFVGPASLSGDGTTALLGVPGQPCSAGPRCGVAYLFTNATLAVGIPTLGGAGLALLTLFLVASALLLLQRRRSL